MTVSVPEQRLLKGAYLLADRAFDSGSKSASLLDLHKLRGTGTSQVPAWPSISTELRAVDVFLGSPPGGPLKPKVDAGKEELAWQDLWDVCELLRLVLARPEVWGERFTVGLASLLDPRERLSLLGNKARKYSRLTH